MNDSRFRSRKFLLTVLAFATFTGLRIANLLDQGAYVTLVIALLGGYGTANLVQKAASRPEAS